MLKRLEKKEEKEKVRIKNKDKEFNGKLEEIYIMLQVAIIKVLNKHLFLS